MNDATLEDTASKLAELLKHPDDLDKLPSLRSEFTRKKAAIDSQLKVGLKDQLEITQNGMSSITEGQKIVNSIKDEMMKIDKLCAEAQGMIRDFPEINRMSVMQRNFAAVESMKDAIGGFSARLMELEELLSEDSQELSSQPNLLAIHGGLSELRDVRDQAMEQVKGADGESGQELIDNLPIDGEGTLQDLFKRLDETVEWFDQNVGTACCNLIPLVLEGQMSLIVRLALVIEEEEKKDKQVKALQDAQREFQDVASRFKALNVGQRELRGYKKKFLQAIEFSANDQFTQLAQEFQEEPDLLEKSCKWYFNELNTVKLGMQDLMPKKWKIFKTYVKIYHKLMHDFLIAQLDDPEITPVHMLAILNWVPKYHNKMTRLGVDESDLKPHVIDSREHDLVREYRSLIAKKVEDWMGRMGDNDKQQFLTRAENSLDQNADNHLHTKSLGDMWTMLRETLMVAQNSGRPDVVEGVVDAMYVTLKQRQHMWERLVDDEARKFETGQLNEDAVSAYHDWLVAIANDQIANIDDDPMSGAASFLTRFRNDFEEMVSPAYAISSQVEHEALSNAYVDLSTHCISLFAKTIFNVDFKDIMLKFFTPNWYQEACMPAIITTFEDYLNDYTEVFHPSLREILVEELADELLVRYLGAVRNKGAKFRRTDPFTDKIREDVVAAFDFFKKYPDAFEIAKEKWRAVSNFSDLLSASKGAEVVEAYSSMKLAYWDVQFGWVEAVLKSRDDFERSMMNSVKAAAADISAERGPDTVMSKVR
jgi:exocyst complex component 3